LQISLDCIEILVECIERFNKGEIDADTSFKISKQILVNEFDDPEFLEFAITPKMLVELIKEKPTIGNAIAKEVFVEMVNTGKNAQSIISERNLTQLSDVNELDTIATNVIVKNPQAVEDYKSGKKNALAFLIGQTMKATKGKANPKILTEIIKEKITGLK